MSAAPTNAGRNRFSERDRFFIPAVKIINALGLAPHGSPHAACKLPHSTGLDRATVDRALQWLKRRNLVEHDGAWRLTELGKIAVEANGGQARVTAPQPMDSNLERAG